MRAVSDISARVTAKTCSRKFIALGRVLRHWDDIIGSDFAAKAQPVKINYRKAKSKNEKPNATLVVATTPANATVLHYQSGIILERINHIFGERWITKINFVTIAHKEEIAPPPPLPQLDATQEKALIASVDSLDDLEIREVLERLGRSVMREDLR